MQPLNLPAYDALLQQGESGTMIFDRLRQRWVILTPEEWVRQHFVNFLITQKGYPPTLMANEIKLNQNGRSRRCDTVVFDRGLHPLMIVEYKRPSVAITQKVFDQIARYNSVLLAPWLIVSNGMRHFCCHFDGEKYSFKPTIPTWPIL